MLAVKNFFTAILILAAMATLSYQSITNPIKISLPALLIAYQFYTPGYAQIFGGSFMPNNIKKPSTPLFGLSGFFTPQITKNYDDYVNQYKPREQLQKGSSQYTYRTLIYNQNVNKINIHNNNTKKRYAMGLNRFSDMEAHQFILLYAKLVIPNQMKKSRKNLQLTKQNTQEKDSKDNKNYKDNKNSKEKENIANIAWKSSSKSSQSKISSSSSAKNNTLSFSNLTNSPDYTVPPNITVDWSCKASAVVNQGACGSCYAIASLQAIYITMRMYGQSAVPLSFQEVISCGQAINGIYGCSGGYFISAYEYVRVNGSGSSIMYPYSSQAMNSGVNVPCNYSIVNSQAYKNSKVRIRSAGFIPFADCRTLVNTLKTQALSVSISTTNFQFYVSGTYTNSEQTPNHGVTLVGYDPQNGYKIKNSWGLTWGNGGYAYISESTGVCDYAMYPVTGFQDLSLSTC